MRYAVIEDGQVANVVLTNDPAPNYVASDVAAPGWAYDGNTFTAPNVAPQPRRITKADFQRLLLPSERYTLNALRKQIAALPPEDYADPTNVLMVAAEDVMVAFDQPAEFIELDHPDTFQGLMLLAYLGVLTPARVAEIVAS